MNQSTLNIMVENQPLHLPPDFSMELNFHSNLLFFSDKQGSYTSPISLPTTPHNQKLLTLAPTYIKPCQVYHPHMGTIDAYIILRNQTRHTIDVDIYFDNGFFFMLASSTTLKQLYSAEIIIYSQASPAAMLAEFNSITPFNDKFTCFPFYAPNIQTDNFGIINYYIDNDFDITATNSQIRIMPRVKHIIYKIASTFGFEIEDSVFNAEPFEYLCFLTNYNYINELRTPSTMYMESCMPETTISEFINLLQNMFFISITFINNVMHIEMVEIIAKKLATSNITPNAERTTSMDIYTAIEITREKGDEYFESQFTTRDIRIDGERNYNLGTAYFFNNEAKINQNITTLLNFEKTYTYNYVQQQGYTITETINIPRLDITEDDNQWRFLFFTGEADKISSRNPPLDFDRYPSASYQRNNYRIIFNDATGNNIQNYNTTYFNWLLNEYQSIETSFRFPVILEKFRFSEKINIDYETYLIESFSIQLLRSEIGEMKLKLLKA